VSTRVEELAMHWSYDQVFVEIAGRMALVVAPAAAAPSADGQDPVAPESVAAFLLEPGDVVMVRKGTWHMTVPLDDVTFVNITRRDEDEDTTASEATRGYIASANLPAASGAVVQLVEPR
jgi:ureidoglycolate hydrolase